MTAQCLRCRSGQSPSSPVELSVSVHMNNYSIKYPIIFFFPSNWVVEDEKGIQGIFYEDRDDSGTLRVSVFEYKSKNETERNQKIKNALLPGDIETLAKGVYLKTEVSDGLEEGEKLSLYRWLVALALPDNLFRLVIFTHTIVEGQESDKTIEKELEIVNKAVRNAEFSYVTDLEFVDSLNLP